ncbi:DUF6097 family protein [Brevibacillus laterosporus]|uniref:DUF6097 family protein n=1 Tax=Brevibacillus laterosporus TaxID=1465 RepID=UPI001E16429C|nr:DUF6097 family protein [Brevibacillus laterosporus]MBM7111171.1 hypothetical protein [Brevibacillus laterosporus]
MKTNRLTYSLIALKEKDRTTPLHKERKNICRVNIFKQFGDAITNSIFLQEELRKAHAFIQEYNLPIEMVENNLHKQIILMENYAGTRFFQQGLAKYKTVNILLMTLSVIVMLLTGIIAGLEYLKPEIGVVDFLLTFMFTHFNLSITLISIVFAAVIILPIIRSYYAKALHGKVLNQAWQAVWQHVTVDH